MRTFQNMKSTLLFKSLCINNANFLIGVLGMILNLCCVTTLHQLEEVLCGNACPTTLLLNWQSFLGAKRSFMGSLS